MDYFVWGDNAERIYESQCCGHSIQSLSFCCDSWDGVHDLLYCYQCVLGSNHCFGCVGIQRGGYCILNKQYTKEEYEEMVPRIVAQMQQQGEWGEFFPAAISPYAYNETTAQEYFPLTREEAQERELTWKENLPFTVGKETMRLDQIPSRIEDVQDSIADQVLACQATEKNFRITKKELEFYRDMRLPVPRFHPDERHLRRMLLRNPRKLWERSCRKCGKEIETTYSPDRPEIVYCEECYLATVY
jgi:hypothetical protein